MKVEIPQNLWAEMQRKIINAQTALTEECKKKSDFYTPMQQGTLKNNYEYTKNADGAIDGWTYRVPYARRQWFGMTEQRIAKRTNNKKGEKKGQPVAARGFNYDKTANPNARSRWTEHAANIYREAIIKAVVAVLEL